MPATERGFPPGSRVLVLLAAAALFPAAGGLPAQERDLDEALGLARQGQFEKAEEIARRLGGGAGAPAEARAAAGLIQAEILTARAETETGLESALKLLDGSIDLLKTYLRANPSLYRAAAARRGIDWRTHRKATLAAKEAAASSGAKKEEALRLAAGLYATAFLRYEERRRELRSGKAPADENEITEVILDGARAGLEFHRLGAGEEGKAALAKAIASLQDCQFDYADDAASFEAMWIEGLCHAEAGDPRAAEDRFLGATTLYRRLEGSQERTPYHQSIVRGAYVSLSENYLQSGRLDDVKALVERAFAEDPVLERDAAGMALKLEKAEALFREGDLGGAHELASQVIHADSSGRLAAAAREKMRAWSSDQRVLGAKPSTESLLIRATARMENEDWSAALADLEAAVEAAAATEARARLEPEAHFKRGQCLVRLGKNGEAAQAYERLFHEFPEHELAPRACFEAVRAVESEFLASRDQRAAELKEKYLAVLLDRWSDHPAARNVALLQAEKLERDKQYAEAAAAFASVPAEAEAYENALIAAGRCRFLAGNASWEARRKDPGAEEAARRAMAEAVADLRRFFDHVANPAHAPRGTEAVRQRATNAFLATRQLALIHAHEAVGRHDEAVKVLDAYAGTLAGDNPRLPQILALKVRPFLALGQAGEAVKTADQLLERYPESPSILPALKAVAVHLEGDAGDSRAKEGEEAALAANLKRIHRYYLKWIRGSVARGLRVGPAEAIAASRSLYDGARRLNGLGDGVTSFAFAPGTQLPAAPYFEEAAVVLRLLAGGKIGPLEEKERIEARLALARSEGFLARDGAGWEKARASYLGLVEKLLSKDGKVDVRALAVHPRALVFALLEFGVVCQELAKHGQAQLFDEALAVFKGVQGVTESGSEAWWTAKYFTVRALVERGGPADAQLARTFLDNLETNYPDYDGDQYGMKTRLRELRSRSGLGGAR